MTAPVLTFRCILLFLPYVPNLILFLYIVNSLTLTPIGIPFLLTMYFLWNSIHHSILSISDHSSFKQSLYNFLITQ